MILAEGDRVLVSNRRMFERDEVRFFLGSTTACEGPLLKVDGYSFVRDLSGGCIVKKEERRTKILSIDSPGYIVYQLPSDVDVDAVKIESHDGEAILVDNSGPLMNLSERTHSGHF